ncbi:hypothetical protein GGI07_003598 [Coemansia sp. Benny D115]|nr:hypothetical protein GGI07_003598 [Coemansia sp. Benny D115]
MAPGTGSSARSSQTSAAAAADNMPVDLARDEELKVQKSRKSSREQSSSTSSPDQTSNDTDGSEDTEDPSQDRVGGGRNGGSTLHIPCKFYKHGNCTAGTSCYFSHDMSLFADKAVCKYFVKGNCRYGNKCALIHNAQNDAPASRLQSKPPNSNPKNAQQQQGVPAGPTSKGPNSRAAGGASGGSSKKDRRANQEALLSNDSSASASASASASVSAGRSSAATSAHRTLSSTAAGTPIGSTGAAAASKPTSSASKSHGLKHLSSAERGSVNAESPGIPIKFGNNARTAATKAVASSWAPGTFASALGRADKGYRPPISTLASYKDQLMSRVDSGSVDMAGPASQNSILQHGDDAGDFSLFGDVLNETMASPFGLQIANSYGAPTDSEFNPRSQPIPKPASDSKWAHQTGDNALLNGGLSLQDSLRIDKLALSYSAAHPQFAGSPFLASSIPLLDQFSDLARNEPGFNLGDSPLASPYASSPPAKSSGTSLLNRHAFTAVDSSTLDLDGNVGSYHSHLQSHGLGQSLRNAAEAGGFGSGRADMSPSVNPIGSTGARSIPHSTDYLGRSMRSSSFANEPLSPLTELASGADHGDGHLSAIFLGGAGPSLGSPVSAGGGSGLAALSGRLRSNSHLQSPSLAGFTSGIEAGSIPGRPLMHDSPFQLKDRQLGGYSLTDSHTPGFEHQSVGSASLWDSYNALLGGEASQDQDLRNSFNFSLKGNNQFGGGSQRGGIGFSMPATGLSQLYPQSTQKPQQSRQQNWTQSPKLSLQGSAHGSPFASALSGFGGEQRQSGLGDGSKPGAIGQKLQRSHFASTLSSSLETGGSGLALGANHRSAFGGLSAVNLAGASSGLNGLGNASTNVSSSASDNYGEMFELESEPSNHLQRSKDTSRYGSSAVPNPQFIPMDGFSQKLSGMSLGHPESMTLGTARSGAVSSQSISSVSAIARPSA